MNGALARLRTSVRDLPQSLILPAWTAGVLVVIVGFTGSLVLALASQNLPGFAVMRAAGYRPSAARSWQRGC